MMPLVAPVAGQAAAITQRYSYCVWRTAVGRDPRRAQTVVAVPFCPRRASSSNQTSTRLAGRAAATSAISPPTFF